MTTSGYQRLYYQITIRYYGVLYRYRINMEEYMYDLVLEYCRSQKTEKVTMKRTGAVRAKCDECTS